MAEWALQNPWWMKKEEQAAILEAGSRSFDQAYAQGMQRRESSNRDKMELLQMQSKALALEQQENIIKDTSVFQTWANAYQKDPDNTELPQFLSPETTEKAIAFQNSVLKRKAAQKAMQVDNDFFRTVSSYKDPSFTAELLEMKSSGAPMSQILPRMRQFSDIERKRDLESRNASMPQRFDMTQSQRIMVEHDLTSLRERERALNDKAAAVENLRILNPKEYEKAKSDLIQERQSLKAQEQSIRGQLQPKAEGGAEAPKARGILESIGGAVDDVLGLFTGGEEAPIDGSPLPMPQAQPKDSMDEQFPLPGSEREEPPLWQQPGYQPSSSSGIRG